jgi:hypothetical protein
MSSAANSFVISIDEVDVGRLGCIASGIVTAEVTAALGSGDDAVSALVTSDSPGASGFTQANPVKQQMAAIANEQRNT